MLDPTPDSLTLSRLDDLKEAAHKLAIEIQFDNFSDNDVPIQSGTCKVHGQSMILIDNRLPPAHQIEVILDIFKQFDWDDVYIASWIREHLDNPEFSKVTP